MSAVRQQPAGPRTGGPSRGSSGRRRTPPSRSATSGSLVRVAPGRHLGPIPVAPLVAWQIGLVVAVIVAVRGGPWLALAAVIVLALVVLTLIRHRQRALWRWLRVWQLFRRRRRAARPVQHEPVLGPLREWLPELEITAIDGRRGASIGVVFDGTAYTMVLGPDGEELITSANPDTIPLRALGEVGEVEGIRLASAQLLVRTVPAPAPMLGTYAPRVGASYTEINQTFAPASASWWIALRLEPARSADSLAVDSDGVPSEALVRALRKLLGWSTKVLASSGLPCRALDENEIREVVALTSGSDPTVPPPTRRDRRTRETWTRMTVDSTTHITGWVTKFPRRGLRAMTSVWSAMAALPVDAATAALILVWSPSGELRCSAYVRVQTTDARAAQRALTQLGRNLGRARVRFARLDGEQLPGLVATIPLGGGTP